MQLQLDRLTTLNVDFRRRASLTRRQAHALIQEKTELQAQLHDKEQLIARAREKLKRQSSSDDTSSPVGFVR